MGSATYKNLGGTSDNINIQYIYIYIYIYTVYRGGARILVQGGNIGKISYMNSFQVLYCNDISVGGGTFSTNLLIKDF